MRSLCKYFCYICDECSGSGFFSTDTVARTFGWSISSNSYPVREGSSVKKKRCWCPDCAVAHGRGRPRASSCLSK